MGAILKGLKWSTALDAISFTSYLPYPFVEVRRKLIIYQRFLLQLNNFIILLPISEAFNTPKVPSMNLIRHCLGEITRNSLIFFESFELSVGEKCQHLSDVIFCECHVCLLTRDFASYWLLLCKERAFPSVKYLTRGYSVGNACEN
ncbi:MAG: hypothetical protein ABIF88_01755 [archaeon]